MGVLQRLVAEAVPQIALSPVAGVLGVSRLPEVVSSAALPHLVEVDVLPLAVVGALSASASMKVAVTNVWSPLAAELPGVLPHLGQVAAEVAYQVALPQMAMVGVLSWPLVVEVALPVAQALWRRALGRTVAPAARPHPAKAVQGGAVTVAVDRVCRASCLAWLSPGSSSPFAQPREVKQDQSLQRSRRGLGPPGE